MTAIERNKLAIGFMQGTKAACVVVDTIALTYGMTVNHPRACFITFGITFVILIVAQVAEIRLRVGA